MYSTKNSSNNLIIGQNNIGEWYLGLDVGTNSCGYACTSPDYRLLRFKSHHAWGVHLFDSANGKAERRAFRTARRRLNRRKQRIRLTQEIFAPAIAGQDPNFYRRLANSGLRREDAQDEQIIFQNTRKQKSYNHKYPTIHHLIVELMNNPAPHDPRLVYLACAYLIKHRGHFLSNINPDNIGESLRIEELYQNLTDWLTENGYRVPWFCQDLRALNDVLKSELGISRKKDRLKAVLIKNNHDDDELSEFDYNEAITLLAGGKANIAKLFPEKAELYKNVETPSLSLQDDNLEDECAQFGEDGEFMAMAKALYDSGTLQKLLRNGKTISEAKIALYEAHKNDLSVLKVVLRKYGTDELYQQVFETEQKNLDNYVAYTGHLPINRGSERSEKRYSCNQEAFCKYIAGILKKLDASDENTAYLLNRIEAGSLCPKQKTVENRVVPQQLHFYELHRILENASRYMPVLSEPDTDGLTGQQKLEAIFTFRIPYYVGPLKAVPNNTHAWLVKKEEGYIYPWNLDQKVDLAITEKRFIEKMTAYCSYLPDCKVLPKNSLLFEKYCVLNEINPIRINGSPISVETKQKIYKLFENHKTVRLKMIEDCLKLAGEMRNGDVISGIDITVKSSLKTFHLFRNFLAQKKLTETQVESIVEYMAYAQDSRRVKTFLKDHYPLLCEDDIIRISKFRIKDFATLSREFLNGSDSFTNCDAFGEICGILQTLWSTNLTLIQIINSEEYSFRDTLIKYRQDFFESNQMSLDERFDREYVSMPVRRAILRTLAVVDDCTKAFGAPTRIFIEMARGSEEKNKSKRTDSRQKQLLALLDSIRKEDIRALSSIIPEEPWEEQIRALHEKVENSSDSQLRQEKLFLYITQLGRDMYTGKAIPLSELSGDKYNRDHIYPQSRVKDDSILNNLVLVDSAVNGKKTNELLDPAIRVRMYAFWQYLRSKNLITEEKFSRLTRTKDFTVEELRGFINRQLVETRQSTKIIKNLLQEKYPGTEIICTSASLASELRQILKSFKSRSLNDLHHAKDAYLNIVAGDLYSIAMSRVRFARGREEFNNYSVQIKSILERDLKRSGQLVWQGKNEETRNAEMKKLLDVLKLNDAHLTSYAYVRHGGFFDQQPYCAGHGQIPRKTGLPVEKYGGYGSASIAAFILANYVWTKGKKQHADLMFVPIPVRFAEKCFRDSTFANQYVTERIGEIYNTPDSVAFPLGLRPIKMGTIISADGFRMELTGTANKGAKIAIKPCIPLIANQNFEQYMHKLDKILEQIKSKKMPDFTQDGISKEANEALFDFFLTKTEESVFCRRPGLNASELKEKQPQFASLDILQQVQVLSQVNLLFQRHGGPINLEVIDLKKAGYSPLLSSKITNWKYKRICLVDQSPTGLWEHETVIRSV